MFSYFNHCGPNLLFYRMPLARQSEQPILTVSVSSAKSLGLPRSTQTSFCINLGPLEELRKTIKKKVCPGLGDGKDWKVPDQSPSRSGVVQILLAPYFCKWSLLTPYTLSRVTFKLQQQSWGVWQRPYDLQSLKYLFYTSLQKIFVDHCSKYIISPHWSKNSEQEGSGMRSWDGVEQGWQQRGLCEESTECSGAREPQAWI